MSGCVFVPGAIHFLRGVSLCSLWAVYYAHPPVFSGSEEKPTTQRWGGTVYITPIWGVYRDLIYILLLSLGATFKVFGVDIRLAIQKLF